LTIVSPTITRHHEPDRLCADAVDLARSAAEEAGPGLVGAHLGTETESDRVVSHLFACLSRSYVGWRWAVTVVRAARSKQVTVSETVLLPGPDSLVAPAWVPWTERVRPGDLRVGDLMPAGEDDERLIPAVVIEGADELLDWDESDTWALGSGLPGFDLLSGDEASAGDQPADRVRSVGDRPAGEVRAAGEDQRAGDRVPGEVRAAGEDQRAGDRVSSEVQSPADQVRPAGDQVPCGAQEPGQDQATAGQAPGGVQVAGGVQPVGGIQAAGVGDEVGGDQAVGDAHAGEATGGGPAATRPAAATSDQSAAGQVAVGGQAAAAGGQAAGQGAGGQAASQAAGGGKQEPVTGVAGASASAVARRRPDAALRPVRVLSAIGRDETAARWYTGSHGPAAALAAAAPGHCLTCGFLVRLNGPLGRVFGVCANEFAPDDGRVVSVDHGCGAHSDAGRSADAGPDAAVPAVDELGYDMMAAGAALPESVLETLDHELL